MLWEVYWNLVAKHGFNPDIYDAWTTGGNNLAIQLVTDGMKFQPCSPGFVDGRNAILAADVAAHRRRQPVRDLGGVRQARPRSSAPPRAAPTTRSTGRRLRPADLLRSAVPVTGGAAAGADRGERREHRSRALHPDQYSSDPVGTVDALSQRIDCTTLAPIGPVEEASGFWRQSSFPRYRFEWRTLPSWEGQCRQLLLRIGSVVDQVAYFRFH